MEVEARGRRSCRSETTGPPNRATSRKVQIVYYLSRNGHLEHPHYMEVTHLPHQPLRLKDVTDRLTVLRGNGMPSLYSWSCKRSYKNGYVWNDLADNDVIYPSEGAEYVLKGSELLDGGSGKFQQLQLVTNRSQLVPDSPTATTFHPKRKPVAAKRHPEPEEADDINQYENKNGYEEDDDDDEEEEDNHSSTRCSKGVSTDEKELEQLGTESTGKNNPKTELTLGNSSPPSTTSSTVSDRANENTNSISASKRFEDGDPVAAEPSLLTRNSVLLQLISCGGSASFRARTVAAPVVKQMPPSTAARKSCGGGGSLVSLHRGVLCKKAAAAAAEEEEEMMIRCMSQNPRFGILQAEEKEYFSGSMAESMAEERSEADPAGLKRSSSYNEERSSKAGMVEEAVDAEPKRSGVMRGRCIPIKKCASKQSKK